tara:strand:- start:114 stop:542 length:429 start_codon:yes stop_codon:yes gene_type:complete
MTDKSNTGRPTKYKDRFIQDLTNYFNVESFTLDSDNKPIPSKFPTLARFALNCDVHTDTLYEWAHGKDADGDLKHPDFSVAYKKAKLYQEAYLYESGLAGTIDKTFGIWATKTILGHREPDKVIEIKQEKLEPLPINIIDAS